MFCRKVLGRGFDSRRLHQISAPPKFAAPELFSEGGQLYQAFRPAALARQRGESYVSASHWPACALQPLLCACLPRPRSGQGRGASYHLGHPHARSPTVSLFFGRAAVSRGRMIPLEQQKSKADLTPPLVYLPWGRPRIFPCRRFPIRGTSRGWVC